MQLHVWRAIHRKTQAWVAEACGCSDATISTIETGKSKPSFALLIAIERVTGGAVQARDFLPQPAPEPHPAAVHEGAP